MLLSSGLRLVVPVRIKAALVTKVKCRNRSTTGHSEPKARYTSSEGLRNCSCLVGGVVSAALYARRKKLWFSQALALTHRSQRRCRFQSTDSGMAMNAGNYKAPITGRTQKKPFFTAKTPRGPPDHLEAPFVCEILL